MKKASLFSLITTIALQAASVAHSRPGAAWANLPAGAREAGLAGGMGSLSQGLQGLRQDPSSAATIKSAAVEASHNQWVQGVTQEQAAAGLNLGAGFGAAISAEWLDMGEVTRYKAAPSGGLTEEGSWHPTAGAATLSLGSSLSSNMAAGLALRGWRQDLDGEGALAVSVSGSLRYKPLSSVTLVAALVDFGTRLDSEELPTAVRAGASWASKAGSRLGVELSAPLGLNDGIDYAAALELPLGSAIVLRGGALFAAGAVQVAPTGGCSIKVSQWSLDFAYRPSALGSTLNAGLSWAL